MAYSKINYNFAVEISLLNGTEEIKLENALKALYIKKDFVSNILSLYVLNLALNVENVKYLMDNNVRISLNIHRYNKTDSNDNNDNIVYDKTVLSLILKPYDKVKYEIHQDESFENDSNNSKIYMYEVSCLDDKLLHVGDKLLNDVYHNTDVLSCYVNMLGNVYNGDVYIEPTDNTSRYQNIIVPPMNINNAMKFIDNEYSAYNGVMNIYFDNKEAYIYKIGSNSIAYRSINIKIINNTQNTDNSIYQTYYADEYDNMNIVFNTSPMITHNKDVVDNSLGKTAIINSYDENLNIISNEYILENTEEEKKRYFWNNKNDIYVERERNNIISVGNLELTNIDFSIFNPTANINISGSEIDINNGTYQILTAAITLQTEDYKKYTSGISISYGKK